MRAPYPAPLPVALLVALALTAGATAARAGACEGGRPALLDAPAVSYLPGDTVLAIATRDPAGLLETFGWSRLRPYLAKASEELREETGHDLLDPASWTEIGLDVHGSWGFAWLSLEDETFAFWATVRDRDAVRRFLDGIARKERDRLTAETFGDALVLQPPRDGNIAFVFRGDVVLFTVSNEGDAAGRAAALAVATTTADDSLARSTAFRGVTDDLGFGRDVAGYVALRPIVYASLGLIGGDGSREPFSSNRWELDRAVNDGASPEEVRALRAAVEEERRWIEEIRRAQATQRALLDTLFEPLGGLAFGLEVREDSIAARLVTDLPRGSLLRRLLRPGDGTPAFVRALDEAPLYLNYARLDLDVVKDVAERMFRAAGGDYEDFERRVRERLRIDLDQDVIATFTGEIGFAVTGHVTTGAARAMDVVQTMGGGLSLGVRDADKARALASRFFEFPPIREIVRPSGDGWRFDVPGWKTIDVALVGDQLVVTTEPGIVERLRSGAAGGWLTGLAGQPLGALLRDDRAEAMWVMDLPSFAWLVIAGAVSYHDDESSADRAADDGVPYSDEWKRLAAERDDVSARADRLRGQRRTAQDEHAHALFQSLGIAAFVGHAEGDHFVACGGQFVAAGHLPTFVTTLVEHVGGLLRLEETRDEIWTLEERRWELEERLRTQRETDIERWRARKPRSGD